MKKIISIALTLTLFAACNTEPLDNGLDTGDNSENPDNSSNSEDLTLSSYKLDTKLNLSFFGTPIQTFTNSDYTISNNIIVSSVNKVSLDGNTFETENQTITRNSSGQTISDISVNTDNITTNKTLITYTDDKISKITYDYYDDDDDDYEYIFTYSENTITRTKVGSDVSTIFTLDDSNRIFKKESFEGDTSVQLEIVTYTENGNISNSKTTGNLERTNTYTFDDHKNPLKLVYNDNYLLQFLRDDSEDEIARTIAQFHTTNNWIGATINGKKFEFTAHYNDTGRINDRTILFDFGEALKTEIKETFTYTN